MNKHNYEIIVKKMNGIELPNLNETEDLYNMTSEVATIGFKITVPVNDWNGKSDIIYTKIDDITTNRTDKNPSSHTYGMFVPIPINEIPDLIIKLQELYNK